MKFFLSGLGNWFNDLTLITDAVVEADRLGFDGALMPDNYMWGWGRGPDASGMYVYVTLETWVTLTYLAAKTEEIRLGTLVTPIPFRPPTILAKMISTLDILSKGRVVLGVGAGWSKIDFEGFSEWNEPKVRVDKTKEALELMILLWTHDMVTFSGNYYRTKFTMLEPKPIQKPYPQLLFGGQGDRMLKLAGRYADICYIFPRTQTPEAYKKVKEKVTREAMIVGRADKIAFMVGPPITTNPYNLRECFNKVEAAIEIGASYYLASFPRNEKFIDSMRSYAREIMPSFK